MFTARTPSLIDRLLAEYEATGDLPHISGGDPDPDPDPKPDEITFDAKQQEKVNNLIAAAKKKAEEDTAARLKADLDAKAQKDKEQRDRDEAAKRGDFDKVKEELEGKVSTYEADLTSTKDRLTALEKLATDRLTALLTDIPKEIADLGPDDDTPIEKRLEWAEKAAKAAEATGKTPRGNGPNPKPGTRRPQREDAKKQARSRISI